MAASLQHAFAKEKIFLGSSSQWRREVLEERGLPVAAVVTPDIDERAIRHDDPEQLVLLIANAKVDACLEKLKDQSSGVLLCSDQVTLCDGEVREKPESADQARTFLRSYNKFPARTVNGLVAVDLATRRRVSEVHHAAVYFAGLTDEIIDRAIARGPLFTCSGGFYIEDEDLARQIVKIEGGSDAIRGLPMKSVESLLVRLFPDEPLGSAGPSN